MFSFWKTNPQPIAQDDVTKSKYDPQNPAHIEFITTRLKAFQDAANKVQQIDGMLFAGLSIDVLLWCIGTFGTGVSILLAAGMIGYATQYEDRPKHAGQLRKSLQELYDAYQWCVTGHGVVITKDKQFISILTQLSPYVSHHDLVLWDLATVDGSQISQEFLTMMAKSPHRLHILGVHAKSKPPAVPDLLQQAAEILDPNQGGIQQQITRRFANYMDSNQYLRMFGQSMAEAKLALYGKKSEVDVNPVRINNLRLQ